MNFYRNQSVCNYEKETCKNAVQKVPSEISSDTFNFAFRFFLPLNGFQKKINI